MNSKYTYSINWLFRKTTRVQELVNYRLLLRRLFVISTVHLLFFSICGADQTQPRKAVVYQHRDQNSVTYNWSCTDIGGNEEPFSITITFNRGIDYMLDIYSTKDHGYHIGRARPFLWEDPFYADFYVVAQALRDLSLRSTISIGEIALSFVQSLPYQSPGNYQRYGIETLIDAQGDCSDKSILLGGILNALKLGWVFIRLPGHLAVGLWCANDWPGTYYEDLERRYYFCETTSTHTVGWSRPEFKDELATIERPWIPSK